MSRHASPARLTGVWLILLAATATTWTAGALGAHGPWVMFGLAALTLVKGRLVILDYMGLRGVRLAWRAIVLGWLLVVLGLIATAYLIALGR